MKYSQS